MRVIQITKPEFSNEIIKDAIDFILNTDVVDDIELGEPSKKGMNIGDMMMHINDMKLLKNTLKLLKSNGFYTNNTEFTNVANIAISNPEIGADVTVRIEAICYGLLLKKECYINKFPSPKNRYLPPLTYQTCENWVKTNLDEIIDEVNRNRQDAYLDEIQKLPPQVQINKFKEGISVIARMKYTYKTHELDDVKELYTELRDNIIKNPSTSETNEFRNHKDKIWFKLGLLIAQGKIIRKGFYFYFENNEFDSIRSISFHIGEKILKMKNPESLRPYLSATLNNSHIDEDDGSEKNVYGYEKINIIYNYCKINKISMCSIFIEKQKKAKRFIPNKRWN